MLVALSTLTMWLEIVIAREKATVEGREGRRDVHLDALDLSFEDNGSWAAKTSRRVLSISLAILGHSEPSLAFFSLSLPLSLSSWSRRVCASGRKYTLTERINYRDWI